MECNVVGDAWCIAVVFNGNNYDEAWVLGNDLVDAVVKRDVPVVLACGVIFAAVYIILNIVADVVSILANPRLRHPK